MAQRDTVFTRDVTEVAVDKTKGQELQSLADLGEGIVTRSQEAKINQSVSAIQNDLAGLEAKYKIDAQGDPLGGMATYKAERQKLFDQYGKNIDPFFQRQFEDATFKIAKTNDAQTTAWAYEQTHKNTVASVNDTMTNYFKLASTDGDSYGKGKTNQLVAMTNFEQARQQLEQFGTQHLGSEVTKQMMETFSDDYMKSFISGTVESNPSKALKLMNDPDVKSSFKDPEHYFQFKSAIEHRAKRVQKNFEQGGVLATVHNDNAPLTKNGGSLTYSQIQQGDFTPAAKEYYETLNGFKGSGKRGGFTAEDKAGYRMEIYESVQKLAQDKEMDAGSVRVLQDSIYRGMSKQAISQSEGLGLIQQITTPLIEKKQKAMSQFSEDSWFSDDIGFGGINDYYDKNVQLKADNIPASAKAQRGAIETANLVNKDKLYNYYMGAVGARAARAGVPIASVPDLPAADRKKIYADSQTDAIKLFLQDKHPALRTMPDVPNLIYNKNGELIQGMAGPRNLKATGAAKQNWKYQKDDKTGEIFRVYPDGKKEKFK
jgi:hypothetical protein